MWGLMRCKKVKVRGSLFLCHSGGAFTADGHEINRPTFVEGHPKTITIK